MFLALTGVLFAHFPTVASQEIQPLITSFPTPPALLNANHPHDRRDFGGCLLACGVLLSFTSCARTATACQCSVLNAAGPVKVDICAGCIAIFFPAAGADLLLAAGYCAGGSTGRVGALSQCSSQCAPLLRGYGNCKEASCLCPTVSTAGAPCSDCLAAINTDDANVVASLISQCGGGATAAPGVVTVTPTIVATSAGNTVGATAPNAGGSTGSASAQATNTTHSGSGGSVSVGLGGMHLTVALVLGTMVGFIGLIF